MRTRLSFAAVFLLLLLGNASGGQEALVTPGEKEPLFRLDADGPTARVLALAFSPDGQTLYAAGTDKVVRVWNREPKTGRFALDRAAFRVPLGPGAHGVINAIAVSDDGKWLAVGGKGVFRGAAGFREPGTVLSKQMMTDAMRQDEGMIYVFDTRTRAVRLLRGHRGPVLALAFLPSQPGKPAMLASAARDWVEAERRYIGGARLWDVDRAESVAELRAGPDPVDPASQQVRKPGLAAWHIGKGPKQVQVALAWEDGSLRLWEVERDRDQPWQAEDGSNNNTAVFLSGPQKLLTASVRKDGARLRLWEAVPGQGPRLDRQREKVFPPVQENQTTTYFYPQALACFGETAAVVVRTLTTPGRTTEDRLFLIDISAGKFGALKGQLALWRGSGSLPVLAADPRGRYLAVAGNREHEVRILAVEKLLQQQPVVELQSPLRSTGTVFRDAALVKKGADWGVLLSEKERIVADSKAREPRAGDLILDLKARALTGTTAGWQTSAAAPASWRAVIRDDKGQPPQRLVTISQGDKQVSQVRLQPQQLVTGLALLPPGPFAEPLLALALMELGEPLVYLYNARTGQLVRHLQGHVDAVHALNFAADGKLLVTASGDQTVCVWSLDDLDKVLGRRGVIRGLLVQVEKGEVVVRRADADDLDPANRDKLAVGEVIEGLAEGKGAFTSLRAFYDAVGLTRPGQKAALRVRDAKGQRRTVELLTDQAVDERKPLLSLFVTRADRPGDRKWLGWSPLGYYDASDAGADRYFGWHFHTGRPEAPTRFAGADEYRKDHYRPGILAHLVEQRGLGEALDSWKKAQPKLPPPQIGLRLLDSEQQPILPDGQGQFLLQRPTATLQLVLLNNFPPQAIDQAFWQLPGDKEPRPFDHRVGREFLADLSQIAWRRGLTRIQVVLRTNEFEPQSFAEQLTVRYQPPPPAPEWKLTGPLEVKRRAFTVEAAAKPGMAGQEFTLRLEHRPTGKPARVRDLGPREKVNETIDLEPGENTIQLVAVNKDALRGHEEHETARLSVQVIYTEVPQPRIILKQVTPLGGASAEPQPIVPGRPLVVDLPRVRIAGQISAADLLTQAAWVRDGKAASLSRFAAGKVKELVIDEEVTLSPGPQTLHFRAKTETSPLAEVAVELDYRPLLPELILEPPEKRILYEREDQPEVVLQGGWRPPRDAQPFEITVRVNDKPVTAALNEAARTWTVRVPLEPGRNAIGVRLSNRWGRTATSEEFLMQYLRPPRVIGWQGPAKSDKPFVTLVADVESPLPLVRDATRVEVNGRLLAPEQVELMAPVAGQPWKVRLRDVDLKEGRNLVRLRVSNAEAECRQPGEFTIAYAPVKPPPVPEAAITYPDTDLNVTEPELNVRGWVRSSSPLRSVELVREGAAPVRHALKVGDLRPLGPDVYEVAAKVTLVPGANRWRLRAVNDGGERSTGVVTVNYLHLPVRLIVDRLVPCDEHGRDQQDQAILAEAGPGGRPVFKKVPTGRVRLEGHVLWDHDHDEQLRGLNRVHVYVNGFPQLWDDLRPSPGQRRRKDFRVHLVLNREENQVEIELPGLRQEAANLARQFTVGCADPLKEQRLHVLAISTAERDDEKLQERVRQAVASPAFKEVITYPPLTGPFTARMVYTQLREIKEKIETRKRRDQRAVVPCNDVVMVYFEGQERISPEGHHFLTRRGPGIANPLRASYLIPFDDLAGPVGELPAAQMLLLDMDRVPAGTSDSAASDQDRLVRPSQSGEPEVRVSVLRYAREGRSGGAGLQLISAWDEGRFQGRTLREVADYVVRKAQAVQARPDQLLPPAVADLVVGAKP